MEVLLSANKACYIWLPGSQPFRFVLHAPYGTEFLKPVASTVPLAGATDDFSDPGAGAKRILARGLTIKGGIAPEAAEAPASYYIGPSQ